jgi:hypothetical protein
MELVLIRNYPGLRFAFAVRRVVRRRGIPGVTWRGSFREIQELLYLVSVTTLLKLGSAP